MVLTICNVGLFQLYSLKYNLKIVASNFLLNNGSWQNILYGTTNGVLALNFLPQNLCRIIAKTNLTFSVTV